ncbi:MAG TPA: PDZ domain-containing protein [Pyrinomonadaceae bacterium]|jgi:serine protease Do
MKAKYFFSLLLALILAAGVVAAQQPAPPPPSPPDEPSDQTFSFFIDGGSFLGIYAENVSRENMARYHMNQVRGVGVTQVVKDSPAEKAGLRKDDVILRIDGENVSSVRKLNRLVSELAPDQSVRVSFSRGGAEQEVTATVAKRSNQSFAGDLLRGDPKVWKFEGPDMKSFKWEGAPFNRGDLFDNDGNFTFALGNTRRIGVSTMELTKQLADYFGITSGKGVLVTSVTDDGPAAKAGVRAGDVITSIEGEEVDSPGDLSRVMNRKKEGDVTLTIIRNKSQQTIRVTPSEARGLGTLDRPQVGRRIVIPRIDFPDIDIAMPRVVVPAMSMPSININLPRIRVTPRARIRTVNGPI